MTNVKEVQIVATVPFCWLGGEDGLADSEAAMMARVLLSPSTRLGFSYVQAGSRPSKHGGVTAMYTLVIGGEEALSWGFLQRMCQAIAKVGQIRKAEARDIENPRTKWTPILTT